MFNLYFACDFCQSLISVILTLLCLGGEILGFLVHTLCISTLDCVCVSCLSQSWFGFSILRRTRVIDSYFGQFGKRSRLQLY